MLPVLHRPVYLEAGSHVNAGNRALTVQLGVAPAMRRQKHDQWNV
jgi:hypothetical protein